MVEEFKVAKCRLVMNLKDSKDIKVQKAGVVTRTGRKWSAGATVSKAENTLELQDIVGNICVGKRGLGVDHFQQWSKAEGKEKRDRIVSVVRSEEEQQRKSRAVELGQQGSWTRWNLPERKITWTDLWKMEPLRISFMLRSVYDTLPISSKLCRWGLLEDPACSLCGGRGTLAHVLSGCRVALRQGRYRWRHDQVLAALADILEKERRQKRSLIEHRKPHIQFVRAGEKGPPTTTAYHVNVLTQAPSWEMRVDLNKRLVLPDLVQTTLRPDIVIWSQQRQKVILVELTVPWEEGCDEAHEKKAGKYQELAELCRHKGWNTWLFPVEVGARGFPAQSVWRMFQKLGLTGAKRKAAIKTLAERAERSSCWLWCRRDEPNWNPDNSKQ
ncbi:uncharacterized protein LOC132552703 [Ylistrum balloti]|uniref:uncharacterized protein LOC132552703 n=1 Tax=Ylistrum balloti TaxID=509963 RepID=UPI002905E8F7|nr:uncharacterized protein LOC132552703 [Ylistrum balloti]